MSPARNIKVVGIWLAAASALAACHPVGQVTRDETPIIERPDPDKAALDPELGLLVPLGPARMQIPKGWTSVPGKERAWRSGSSQPGATLNVIVGDPGEPGAGEQEIWTALSRAYQGEAGEAQRFIEDGPVDLGRGRRAWRFLIEREEQGARYRLMQLIVVGQAHTYYLTFTTRAEDFDAAAEGFWRVARGFSGDPSAR